MIKLNMIADLGTTIQSKSVVVEELSSGGVVVLGTPKLTYKQVRELRDVCEWELYYRDREIKQMMCITETED